ncbi:centrosomal protein of 164 kDa-like isoform X2 [Varroa jacobsoni]|uniref:WW domain-containing protein n=1 Tax=Varroa destructor TaxID=109461 RepID=A0A7M7MJZ9_VARDE|nr:centrosomal protein of 164 kDa-like isoform X2 [Varroa destructor]XP_022692994.1 centrosomal protein of 164 kDa-like isoform X2 [Varroa jacobsoni]
MTLGETCPTKAMSITSVVRRTARLLKEVAKDDEPPCDEDVRTFADHIGIRLPAEEDLLWIARCALTAAVPPPWLPVEDTTADPARVYYYNTVTAESCWEHPLDAYYKMFVKQERFKMVTKATSQRQQRNSEDSGTSLMSSLDDVPPLSAAMSAKESDSVFHMSLRRRTASQRSRSRSCPSGLNRKSPGGLGGHSPVCETNQDDGSKRTGATSEIASENQTSTVKIREEACVIKELTLQKKHLMAELNKLKNEVRKYQFIRERIKFSPQSELPLGTKGLSSLGFSTPLRAHSASQTDVSMGGMAVPTQPSPPKAQPRANIGNRKTFLSSATTTCSPLLAYSTLPTTKQEHEARVSHDDLLRISERVDQLRQRHHEIALKAVQELIEDPPIAAELLQSSHNMPPLPSYPIQTSNPLPEPPRDFRSSANHHGAPPPLVPPHMSNVSNVHPVGPIGSLPASLSEGPSRVVAPSGAGPQQMTSQEEWVRRLVKLRCGINECKLKQLAIK